MLLAKYVSIAAETFTKFDIDQSGYIDAWELKEAMKSLGQNLSDDELFGLLAQVDSARSSRIVISPFADVEFTKTVAHADRTAQETSISQNFCRFTRSTLLGIVLVLFFTSDLPTGRSKTEGLVQHNK